MKIINLYGRLFACLLYVFIFVIHSFAQNLVPNPGFEYHTSCPHFPTGVEKMVSPPWAHPHNLTVNFWSGSPDLYQVCSNPFKLGVPYNVNGFQYPHSGEAYAGIITALTSREYLQAPLLEPLKAGETYYVGFYISLADRWCAGEDIGVYLSSGSIPEGNNNIFNYEPQIEADIGFLNDSATWVLIDGCYIASGGEDYIIIGNFRSPTESDIISPCDRFHAAYYYIDDIFLYNISTLDIGDDVSLCNGDSLTLHAGFGNTSYLWQDLSNVDTFLVLAPGVYYVETTNICGYASDTMIVSLEMTQPQIDLPDTLKLCQGDEIVLDPQIQGVQFAWSDGSDLSQLTIDTPGEYGLTITNGCGSDEEHVTIEDAGPLPTVSLGNSISICPGELLEVQAIGSNADTWLWSDGSTSPTIFISNPGLIHVTVMNECGTASDTVNVIQSSEPPELDLGEDILACDGEFVLLQAYVTGVNYLWQNGSTQSSMIVTDQGTFSLQVSNACGSSFDTIEVYFNSPPPFPFLGNDTTLCKGEVLTLQWSGPNDNNIQWESGSSSPFNFVDQSGQYYIMVTNACGTSFDTIEVLFIPPPEPFSLGNDTSLCLGQSLLLAVPTNTGTITWQDGSHQGDFLANQSQSYSAIISNPCGSQSDEIYVEFDDNKFTVPTELTKTLCPQEHIVLDVTQSFDVEYQWNTGSSLPSIEITSLGNYTVSISNNCLSETIGFEVVPGTLCDFVPNVFVPNVFTPNGDNINDLLIIASVPYIELFDIQFMVYDRWGSLVYNSNILPIVWDGTFKNGVSQPGVYTYRLKLNNKFNGVFKIVTGDITIIL